MSRDSQITRLTLRDSAIAKATKRLVPFLVICYIVNFLDRVNVGFAALHMNRDLGFSPSVYGLGAGIFFVGYIAFEIPSNFALQRFGARIWIARIMISWGIIATAMALVHSDTSFYAMRLLLGIAEAGFFPGIILYLTYWFPAAERARIVALFMTAVPLATVIGGPISGALLEMHGIWGLAGWHWLTAASRRRSCSWRRPLRSAGSWRFASGIQMQGQRSSSSFQSSSSLPGLTRQSIPFEPPQIRAVTAWMPGSSPGMTRS